MDRRHILVFQGKDAGVSGGWSVNVMEDRLRLSKGLSSLQLKLESYKIKHGEDNY